jgi:cyclic pyranopterin phosphate synthase
MSELTHLDDDGRARMVDVGGKPVTHRVAIAEGRLDTTAEVVALVRSDGLKKADVLPTARVAGIAAAKRTSELIPLAHIVPLDAVSIDFGFGEAAITIRATASTTARTGIEMEALTAVAVAGLTLHDMVKAVDPAAQLGGIRLVEKRGGKRGIWLADAAALVESGPATSGGVATAEPAAADRAAAPGPQPATEPVPERGGQPAPEPDPEPQPERAPEPAREPAADSGAAEHARTGNLAVEPLGGANGASDVRRGVVLVVSTRAAAGSAADTTGPVIVDWLRARGFDCAEPVVVADVDVAESVRGAVAGAPTVLVTTGGTGVNPGDRTPEATRAVLDQELPGVAEAIRAAGRATTPTAALSRALAGVAGRTIVVNLPGSRGGVGDGLRVLDGLLPHLVDQIAGGDHAPRTPRGHGRPHPRPAPRLHPPASSTAHPPATDPGRPATADSRPATTDGRPSTADSRPSSADPRHTPHEGPGDA